MFYYSTTFPTNQTYLLACLVSTIFSSLLQQSRLGKQNRARNLNFGWLHTCEPKSVLEIVSIRQSTKTDKNELILAVKLLSLSTRPRQKAGKIYFKMQCRIQTAQICQLTKRSNVGDGCTITDIKSKANVFIHHYVRVSKLNMTRADWDLNRHFKKRLNALSADDEICAPLQMG